MMEMLGVSDLDLISVVYLWIYIRRIRREDTVDMLPNISEMVQFECYP